jgi:hypothetical protein
MPVHRDRGRGFPCPHAPLLPVHAGYIHGVAGAERPVVSGNDQSRFIH